MNIILAISTVSLALQVAAALAALVIARAPGWRRVRIVSALAFTAGLYSFFNLFGAVAGQSPLAIAWVTSANLTVAATHVAVWTWFSFSNADGDWNSVPRRLRILAVAQVAWTAGLAMFGGAIDATRIDEIRVAALNVAFVQPTLTPLASLSIAITLGVLILSLTEQVKQMRRGVSGAALIVVGFVVFVSAGLEEVAVAAGLVNFIYLAELGYLALVIPVLVQFIRRFSDDAHRLRLLTDTLGDEVARKTAERDAAREALAAQARFTALGRMAGGVGHEINNPLQVLTVLLDELRDGLPPDASHQRESVEHCIAATQRIERIVDGMRAYAMPSGAAPVRVAPAELVRDALAAMRPQLTGIHDVRVRIDSAPYVFVERERVTSAIVHAITNALVAVSRTRELDRCIEVATRTARNGEAVIEVRDNGAGFPPELLPRLGEPFLTTRPTQRSAGLGLFVMRGVIDAQGGELELENAPEGGAVVRFRLRAAAK